VLDYTSEEMTAFETVGASAGEINACFDKWARVLRSVGVPADATFVAAALQRTGLVGTRRTRPHSDTIYNSDEVARVLGTEAKGYPWISYRDSAGQAQAHDDTATRSSEYEEQRGAQMVVYADSSKALSYNNSVARVCIPPKAGSTSFWVSHNQCKGLPLRSHRWSMPLLVIARARRHANGNYPPSVVREAGRGREKKGKEGRKESASKTDP
jgi:hypothetical protein